MKTGILLLNFGGPWTLKDVKPFLYRLFSDPAILVGIPTPFRQLVAFAISQAKGKSSIENYSSIGGGSPQLKWTEIQAEQLRKILSSDLVQIEIGMRSAEPSIPSALSRLRQWGAEKIVLFPLFPQYSTTTTGTCFTAVRDSLRKMKWEPALMEIRNWPDHPGYSGLLRNLLDETIAQAEAESSSAGPLHILFSAHSLPLSVVRRGDPYPEDVHRTWRSLSQGLLHPHSLCFQSRNGRLPWLEPYTENAIEQLGKSGVKRLIMTPISFVSDHIETLWELDLFYAEIAKNCGISHYYRVKTFNDHPVFPEVLRNILAENGL